MSENNNLENSNETVGISTSELKKLYDTAVKENKDEFSIRNIILITVYAKYLLEYLKLKNIDFVELTPQNNN